MSEAAAQPDKTYQRTAAPSPLHSDFLVDLWAPVKTASCTSSRSLIGGGAGIGAGQRAGLGVYSRHGEGAHVCATIPPQPCEPRVILSSFEEGQDTAPRNQGVLIQLRRATGVATRSDNLTRRSRLGKPYGPLSAEGFTLASAPREPGHHCHAHRAPGASSEYWATMTEAVDTLALSTAPWRGQPLSDGSRQPPRGTTAARGWRPTAAECGDHEAGAQERTSGPPAGSPRRRPNCRGSTHIAYALATTKSRNEGRTADAGRGNFVHADGFDGGWNANRSTRPLLTRRHRGPAVDSRHPPAALRDQAAERRRRWHRRHRNPRRSRSHDLGTPLWLLG